jgi:hypothetical protein
MNKIKIICLTLFIALGFTSCKDDDSLTSVNLGVPQNIDAKFSIKQDNSGDVTITPTAGGANFFFVNFGDGSEVSEEFQVGRNITHTYQEGSYTVEIFAKNIAGEIASVEKELLISFLPPENLEVNITISNSNPLEITVEASADNAMGFDMFFGEVEDEEATFVLAGDVAVYEYASVGTFTVTVIAQSGGEATTTYQEEITITDPFVLPINFESTTVNYLFNNFGGGEGVGVPIIDNPDPNNVNNSPKVASYTKPVGSEVWAGTSALLNEAINFSSTTTVAMDVWAPQVGTPILFKVEQEGSPDVFIESIQNTEVANEWHTLTFNLPGANQGQNFNVIAIFFNWETSGADETYYFDNIRLTNPVLLGLPLDFEAGAGFYNFTEFAGAPTEVIQNPDPSGINTSANVARTLKATGAATFAGAFIDITEPIDLSISTTLSMKVWSPIANNQVLLKLEDPLSDAETEVFATLNTSSEWTELTFDFSGAEGADTSIDWTRVIFFFDFGNDGTGLEFYFDDLNYVTEAADDIVGTWVMANEDGSLGVGPAVGDISWWNCNGPCLTERACYFDDTYTFSADGSFTNGFGTGNTWVESWQGVANDQCDDPVAPHDGSNAATYTLSGNSLTLTGEGAYIGLAKAMNAGELPNVPVPGEVTYNVTFEGPTTMRLTIESGAGVFWQYKLVKQ